MERSKIKLILLIGVILLIIAPIMNVAAGLIILDTGQKELHDDSSVGITRAYALEFTLGTDQTFHAEFSNNYQNVTVRLVILSKNEYDQLYATNSTPPTTGLIFRHYTRTIGANPSTTSDTNLRIDWDGTGDDYYVYLDFKGSNLVSIPGTYVMVIFGENEWAESEQVFFDIKASVDGPGRILFEILLIAGVVLIVGALLIETRSFIKKEFGGGR